jgi:hypothetical protein
LAHISWLQELKGEKAELKWMWEKENKNNQIKQKKYQKAKTKDQS